MWRRLRLVIRSGWHRLMPSRRAAPVAAYSHPHVQAADAGRDGMTMFEQHDRWLEELREHTGREELVTCTSGHMPLTAIVAEIAEACADAKTHDKQKIRDWQSMASDLSDTLDWIGPELRVLVDRRGQAIHRAIITDLLAPGPGGGARLDDTKRPVVGSATAALTTILGGDDLLLAAWRDLVAACRSVDHTIYPVERVKFLRDTLIDLSEYRKQARGYGSPVGTAVDVVLGNASSVRYAQAMVGNANDTSVPFDPRAEVGLTESELGDLAERCIVVGPPAGEYVVWFRIHPAFVPRVSCVTHGDVTFYDAQTLAGSLGDHQRAREFEVVPEELLTAEIRDLQLSGSVDDYTGFQYAPQLVYARVAVRNVERHRALDKARMYLDTVLAVVGVPAGMWKVLGGHLMFVVGQPPYPPVPRWGLKEPRPDPVFPQNDFFTTRLAEMTADGHVVAAASADQLQKVLRLRAALDHAPPSDSEAVVMAAVRAIEHCNTWAVPAGGLNWYDFAVGYLSDGYTVTAVGDRVAAAVFAAVEQYQPGPSPDETTVHELEAIRQDISATAGYGTRIDKLKTTAHVAALKGIYADHWLARWLSEIDGFLTSTTTLGKILDLEQLRFRTKVARLRRTRNALIHGGTLSELACATISDFAAYLARHALNGAIWAIVTGEQVNVHAADRRDESQERIRRLKLGGDLANLFKLT